MAECISRSFNWCAPIVDVQRVVAIARIDGLEKPDG